MAVRNMIKLNRGLFAVTLSAEGMLKYFKFGPETTALKAAVIKSIDECISTYIVDTLVEYDDTSIIDEFIATLVKIDQVELIKWCYVQYKDADNHFYNYTHARRSTKSTFNYQNYDAVCTCWLQDVNDKYEFMVMLQDAGATSPHVSDKTMALFHQGMHMEAFKLLFNAILNGGDYETFKKCTAMFSPKMYKYL